MKFYTDVEPDFSRREQGLHAMIEAWPDTSGPKVKPIRIVVPDFFQTLPQGKEVDLARIRGTLYLAPPEIQPDPRVAWIVDAYKPGHRKDAKILDESTVKPLVVEYGYGAFGAGFVALVILQPGERFCYRANGGRYVIENHDGIGVRHRFTTKEDYELHIYGTSEMEKL